MSGAIIVGAGPGIGTAVARRVAWEGLTVGVIARSQATVDAALWTLPDVEAAGVAADVTDEVGLGAAHYWRLHRQPVGAWGQEVVYTGREPVAIGSPAPFTANR